MLVVRSNDYSVIFENVSFRMDPRTGILSAYGCGLPATGAVLACYNNPAIDKSQQFENNREKLKYIMDQIIEAAIEAKDTINVFRIPEYVPTKE